MQVSGTTVKESIPERTAVSTVSSSPEFCSRANEVTQRADLFKDDESFVADQEWWIQTLDLELQMLESAPTVLRPLLPEIRNGIDRLREVLERHNFDINNPNVESELRLFNQTPAMNQIRRTLKNIIEDVCGITSEYQPNWF